MAREIEILNARKVETLKEPGRHADGGNLYLSISKNGGKRWVFFYRFGGKRKEMGLGSAAKGNVGLLDARKEGCQGPRARNRGLLTLLEAKGVRRQAERLSLILELLPTNTLPAIGPSFAMSNTSPNGK